MTVEENEDDEGVMMCLKVTKEWKDRSRQKTGGKMKTGIPAEEPAVETVKTEYR